VFEADNYVISIQFNTPSHWLFMAASNELKTAIIYFISPPNLQWWDELHPVVCELQICLFPAWINELILVHVASLAARYWPFLIYTRMRDHDRTQYPKWWPINKWTVRMASLVSDDDFLLWEWFSIATAATKTYGIFTLKSVYGW
jgi:hypothetical protein